MTYIQQNNKKGATIYLSDSQENGLSYLLPVLLMITIYFSCSLEISNYWNQLQLIADASKKVPGKEYGNTLITSEFKLFRGIWLSIYTMIYLFLLGLVNVKKIKNYYLGWINMVLDVWVLFFFVTVICYNLNVLQDKYLHVAESLPFHQHGFSAFIRYISYATGFLLIYSLKIYITNTFIYPTKLNLRIIFDIIFNVFLCTIGSYQLVHFFFVYTDDPLLGKHFLSIMWGIYALVLIFLGISKQQKHLRIMAITLFSITLIKLFVYDTEQLGTIGKTVVFVSVGILLLIVSFLYNQYKSKLLQESNVE
jgi:peptidoglycan/LPS O-acetylase OafA/YrhL